MLYLFCFRYINCIYNFPIYKYTSRSQYNLQKQQIQRSWILLDSPNVNLFIIYLSSAIIAIIFLSGLFSLYTQYRLNNFVAKCQSRLGNDLVKSFTHI